MPAPTSSKQRVQFGVFELDLTRGELRKRGAKVKLQEQPLKILQILLENSGQIVSREELQKRLWPSNTFVEFDQGLYSAMARLRDALGDSSDSPRFIETMARRGYRFIAAVTHVPTAPISVGPPELRPNGETGRTFTFRRLAANVVAGLVGGALLLAAMLEFDVAGAREWLRTRTASIRSIAVLPLQNLSGDPDQEYFAEGFTDELITDLGKAGAVRVISRTSVMSYKGTRKPLGQIARELNVDAIVEGTVLPSAGRVRITAQLIRVSPESHLWAESYERDLRDVLALQDDVARDIAREVSAKIAPAPRSQIARARGVDPEAHAAYLKGLYHTARYTEEEIQRGIDFFSQAVRKDPQYAPAYAGMARAYTLLSTYYVAPREAMPKARAAAMKALELDESLAEAHTSLGNVRLFYDWEWQKAAQEFRRAIELNPNSADAHDGYANYLVAMARHDESVAEGKRAIELDPLSLVVNSDAAGNALYFARRYDQDIELCRKTIEFDPNFGLVHFYLAQAYAQTGRFRDAIDQAKTGYQLDSSPVMTGLLGEVYASLGNKAETEIVLGRLDRLSKQRYVCSYQTAAIYQGLGQKDQALKWLSRAYDERSDCIPWLKVDPLFDGLRADPRFQELLRRSRLAQ